MFTMHWRSIMQPMFRVFCLALALAICSPAAASPQIGVTAELGPELDTNATRLRTVQGAAVDPVMAGLMRLTARASLSSKLGDRHFLRLIYGGGGKLFWDGEVGEGEDELVQHASLDWAVRLPSGAGTLWTGGDYYDAYQRTSTRDFRTGQGRVRLNLQHPSTGARGFVLLSYRGLKYKPDGDLDDARCIEGYNPSCARYSFHGPLGELGLGWRFMNGKGADAVEWGISVSYGAGLRLFNSLIRGHRDKCAPGSGATSTAAAVCAYFKEGQRQDLNHLVRAQLDYQGNADFSLWYWAEINRSNSFGSSYIRHVVGLKFTTVLFWQIYLTAKGVLQIRQDEDPLFFGLGDADRDQTFINIEEENRSSVTVQLARDLGFWDLSVLLRYSVQVGEAVSAAGGGSFLSPSYLRQTLFGGLRYQYGE